jgi:PEP-CTERM motif
LGTYSLSQDPTKVGFFGVTSDLDAITGIQFNSVHGGIINTGVDNILLGSTLASVPEPSSLILAALGAIALFVSLGKARRKA